MYSWTDYLRYALVIVGPGDIGRGVGLRLADEGGVVVVQNVHRLQQGDDTRRYNRRQKNKPRHYLSGYIHTETIDQLHLPLRAHVPVNP